MKPSNKRFRWILIAVVLCAIGAGGAGWWWRSYRPKAIAAAALPPRPDLAGMPSQLRDRIREADDAVVAGRDSIESLAELSRLYHANGHLAEARQCYEGLEKLDPREGRWYYRHAMIVAGFGEMDSAVALLRKATEIDASYLPARLRLGDILLKDNKVDEAIAVFDGAQSRDPGEPYSLLGLARCDMDRGLWQAAREKLERVVQATNYALGYDLIVPVYERLGLQDRAAEIRGRMKAWGAFRDMADPWMEELNADSYDAFQLSVVAGAMKVRGDRNAARILLERSVSLAPNNAALHFQYAMLLVDLSELPKAKSELERCTVLDPTFADGWAYLSGVLSTMGDNVGAQRVFAEGLARCPNSPGLHRMQANQLRAMGRIDEAVREYRESIRLRPTEAEPYIELGMTLMSAGRTADGLKEFENALVAEPENPMVLTTLAFNAIQTHDETAARQWLDRARKQPRVLPDDIQRLVGAFRQTFGREP